MKAKKQIKIDVKEEFKIYKASKKERKEELSKLSKEDRKITKSQDKLSEKSKKKERKEAIKSMDKTDKKAAKFHDKYFRKLKRRPIKRTISGLLAFVLIIGIINAAPYISDVKHLTSIKLDSENQAAKDALVAGEKVSDEIVDEGMILLKNQDDVLPLKDDKKVNVFGFSSFAFRQGGAGSGATDLSRSVDFYEGLKNSGISYNKDLYDFYNKSELKPDPSDGSIWSSMIRAFLGEQAITDEPAIDYLKSNVVEDAKKYSDTAIIVLSSDAVESSDAAPEELKLTDNKRALIDTVATNFSNVIIIVNAGNQIELGIVDEYESIKSVLWVGTPGARGANSVGKVLAGAVNPSGRLTDTYAYNNDTTPANENFGDYDYVNSDKHFLNYEEGIYIGYRFYETYYQNEEDYEKAVQYSFGYGLSYTDFEWNVLSKTADTNKVSVEVQVKNTGLVAGKDVVQVYYEPPYITGGIEKSSIVLGGFEKTKLIKPGESDVVKIEFNTRDMSSYDMNTEQAWVLDQGSYKINVSKNVHNTVDSFEYVNADKVVYKNDDATGTEIKNQFDYAAGDLTYLSRNNWDGTYPTDEDTDYKLSDDVIAKINEKVEPSTEKMPTTEADNGIKLEDLKGLDYDDPKWDEFLDQFSVEEMRDYVGDGAYQTLKFDNLGIKETVLLDGPAGFNYMFGQSEAASYPSQLIVASTWNVDLAYKLGESIGTEANALGIQGWYAPGMNLHRNEGGGRNFEYFSEDPLMSGKMGSSMVAGAQSKDIVVFMKHFALNDNETNARSGLYIWANEQSIRELYLKPFEITTKESDVHGVMSSFVHFGYKWAGGNEDLLQNVLRDEWGFVGVVSTDAVLGSWMNINEAIRGGNDLMLNMLPTNKEKSFQEEYDRDPVGMTIALRDRVHNISYTTLNYTDLYK